MEYSITSTTKPTKDKDGKDLPIEFVLEDKDFLLIDAINKLSKSIDLLREVTNLK